MSNIIGIDLGTTYSCVGIYENNKVQIIPNSMGERNIPSIVCFKDNEIIVGKQAKKQIKNIENVIYDSKRLIGRNFTDKEVQNDMKYFSFKLESDKNNKPIIIVTINNEKKSYSPEDISSIILKQLKKSVEDYLGCKVKDAIITVPANFNNLQRKATFKAAELAGLNLIRTINEPIAAAIAYGFDNLSNIEKNICVFDFGGGTLDVSILKLKNKDFKVLSNGGDSHLGGEDIDNLLMKYCIDEFKNENSIDISNDQKALRRLKTHCEQLKIDLSEAKESEINIDGLYQGIDFSLKINRAKLEYLCKDLFNKCLKVLDNTIKESGINKNEINDLILVGGSSRIPKIQEMIEQYCGDKNIINKRINADEAVAIGATLLANKFPNDKKDLMTPMSVNIIDVLPHSLGIRTNGGKMDIILKKNTKLEDCKCTKMYTTSEDYIDTLRIKVYEGENKDDVDKNIPLKTYYFGLKENGLKGSVKVNVTFKVDENSILYITAEEKGSNNQLNDKLDIKTEREKGKKNIPKQYQNDIRINTKTIKNINSYPPPVAGNIKRSHTQDVNFECSFF